MKPMEKRLEEILDNDPPYIVYILECKKPGHVYVGYTNDFRRRIKEHETGKGAEFTRVRGVERVLYLEPHTNKEKAMQRETMWTLYCILQMGDFDKVGGGKYPQVIKSLSARQEIFGILRTYIEMNNGDYGM